MHFWSGGNAQGFVQRTHPDPMTSTITWYFGAFKRTLQNSKLAFKPDEEVGGPISKPGKSKK